MFLHNLKYELKAVLRVKEFLIWIVIFPLALGTVFKIGFGDIYNKTEKFKAVPVAVVADENETTLRQVLEGIENSDEPLLKVTYVKEEDTKDIELDSSKAEGIIRVKDGRLTLAVGGRGMNESILKAFCDQYNSNVTVITDTAQKDPAKIQAVTEKLTRDVAACEDIKLTDGNTDYYVDYFYNLIAMTALFGGYAGLTVIINNQANLSALGARKNCSPTPKSLSGLAAICSRFIMQTGIMMICVSYLHFVLKIDFGKNLALVYFTAIMAGNLGISFGFMVGSIGKASKDSKQSLITAVSLILCFLSGLMVAGMKVTVSHYAPFFNEINPAAVISDSFYILNTLDDLNKYFVKIAVMLVMTVLFTVIGFVATRRRKYASL